MQIGGRVLGSGTFNVIKTIDSINESPSYYVDYFDLLTGRFSTSVYSSKKKLIDTFVNKIVLREIVKLNSMQNPVEFSYDTNDSGKGVRTISNNCFSRLLHSHWNSIPVRSTYKRSFVNTLLKLIPEWMMLWIIFSQGILLQHHAIDEFTIFYTDPSEPTVVALCIRTENTIFPVYKRFDGDITDRVFTEKACLNTIFDMVESVLLTLTYCTMYGLYHHFDIKPKNIMYKRTRSVSNNAIKIRLGDYDGLTPLPNEVPLTKLTVLMSDGYSSPAIVNDRNEFISSFEVLRSLSSYVRNNVSAVDIWNSWQPLLEHHVNGEKSKESSRCSLLDLVLAKNDLYGLGSTLLSFTLVHTNASTKKKLREVYKFGMDLMYGSVFSLKEFGLDESSKISPFVKQDGQSQITTISEAASRLSGLRKMFSDKEKHDIKVVCA